METLEFGLAKLKTEFSRQYKNTSHQPEPIPLEPSSLLPLEQSHLDNLHKFAKNNPIYTKSFETDILGVPCIIYEGDINHYWLDSIKHDTSYAPFYPTWMLSALVLALESKHQGFKQILDIGSGDGRIAYCACMVGIDSFGLEIDENLTTLQQTISNHTGILFKIIHTDATVFDYSTLNPTSVAFFISGLPQVGEMLANNIIDKILNIPSIRELSTFVQTGTFSIKKEVDPKWGWSKVLDKFSLHVNKTITLPTHWTLDQQKDTPFIFSSLKPKQ